MTLANALAVLLEFTFQDPHGSSQLSIIQFQEIQHPLQALHTECLTYRQNTRTSKIKLGEKL